MEIYWKDNLKKKVESLAQSDREVAKRLNSIKAATSFKDLELQCNGRAHFLRGTLKGHFSIDLCRKGNGKRFICLPCGDCKKDNSGNYIRETITEINILRIEDYH
jgi:plasmid maintenance system killer protein